VKADVTGPRKSLPSRQPNGSLPSRPGR